MKYRPSLCITIYSSVSIFTNSLLTFLNKLRRRLLNITFSLLSSHDIVFVHLKAIIFLEIQIHSFLASSKLFCNKSRYIKRRWSVIEFQRVVFDIVSSLDITLRE